LSVQGQCVGSARPTRIRCTQALTLVAGDPLTLLEAHSKQAALRDSTAFLRANPSLLSAMDQLMLPLLHRVYSAQVDASIRSVVRPVTPSLASATCSCVYHTMPNRTVLMSAKLEPCHHCSSPSTVSCAACACPPHTKNNSMARLPAANRRSLLIHLSQLLSRLLSS
jgi:hypothetical protein